ncbi:MAG: AAA family ATPase [Halobacteriaceae archaeon]
MRVIGTVGLPGSGKGEAANVAKELDIPVVTMGDVIREECRERDLDPAKHHGEVAKTLREEEGPAAIAERTLPRVQEALESADTVLIDGIRSDVEVERFKEEFGSDFYLVSIEAPFEERAQRLSNRGRDGADTRTGETLRERDQRELNFGMEKAMDQADVVVENTGTLASFRQTIETLLTGEIHEQ